MFRRLLVIGSISTVLIAVLAVPVNADAPYEFATLYSSEKRTALDRQRPSYRAAVKNDPGTVSSARDRRVPWEVRVPWWREEAIERGPLAPYDQERTFEQSLESGRAYPEASRKYRRANDTDPAVGLSDREEFAPVILIVAAAFWEGARRQASDTAALPTPGPTIRYKGVSLIGSKDPGVDNDGFFATVKKAIGMTAALPDRLRSYAERIDMVIYDPPSESRHATGAILDFDGVYMITDVRQKAPLVLYKDMRFSSPLRVAMSLLGGGVMAARHGRLIELLERRGDATEDSAREREINERLAPVSAADPALVNKAECQLQFLFYEADKAFGVGQQEISARLRLIRQRQC